MRTLPEVIPLTLLLSVAKGAQVCFLTNLARDGPL